MWAMDFNYVEIDKALALQGSYDYILVMLSIFLAFIGSYSGLATVGNLKILAKNTVRYWALMLVGSLSMGGGIFAMHFIGMVAYNLPLKVNYDITVTAFSFVPAFIAAFIGLSILKDKKVTATKRWIVGIFFGIGVGLMHYIGMAAMRMDAMMLFDGPRFLLSLLIVIIMAGLALNSRVFLKIFFTDKNKWFFKIASPMIMALAISLMHYIGMMATYFFPGKMNMQYSGNVIETSSLSLIIAGIFLAISIFAIMTAYFDQQLQNEKRDQSNTFLPSKEVRQKFQIFMIPGVIAAIGIVVITYYVHSQSNLLELQQKAKLDSGFIVDNMEVMLHESIANLKVLALSDEPAEALLSGSDDSKNTVIRRFFELELATREYDQIRLLDASGLEVVRVNFQNGEPYVVPIDKLQNKSDRPYFLETFFNLNRGEFYISDPELNMEFGQIEYPFKPVIRLATPVYDLSGTKRGILVFNYLGTTLLQRLRNTSQGHEYTVMLVDDEGNYLVGEERKDDWAEQRNTGKKFSSDHPSIWPTISVLKEGQIDDDTGIFTFQTINSGSYAGKSSREKIWKVIIHGIPAKLSIQDLKNHPIYVVSFIIAILIYILSARFIAIASVAKIRDQKQIEKLFHEVEFQKFAMDQHAIVSITDVKGNITYANDKFCQISGYSLEELIGENHNILKSDQHSDDFYKKLWQTIAKGNIWSGHIRNKSKDGGYYWVDATIVPSLNEMGKPFQYVAIRTDITKQMEIASQLELTLEEAFAATQAKSEFLANMSHEIRTPMNAIIGLSDLCLLTDLSSKQHDYVKKTNSAGRALLGIINDILDFSKIEAGKLDIETISFSLDKVFDNLWTLVSDKAKEKGIELLFSKTKDVPFNLSGDPMRLGQILINLVNNAVKFTDNGEIVLYVKVNEIKDDKISLQFEVKDTGIGMTKEQLEGLFQSFSQADTSTSRKYGGTGLGLSISKQLVELMDGKIWVESEYGNGSSFFFDIEFGITDDKRFEDVFVLDELSDLRILLVDDNETARTILGSYLDSFSFDTSMVTSGQEALAELIAADPPYDLVIIDWSMPVMDGLETTRRIMEDRRIVSPPHVIMISAVAREDLLAEPGAEHLSGFLTKPISPSSLFDAILQAYGKTARTSLITRGVTEVSLDEISVIQGAHILLVEDNEVNQQVASENLKRARFFVDIANNGQVALDMLETSTYDLVLMDVQMPVMNGYDATRAIRADQRFKNLPVLAMTANATVSDKKKAIEAGMNDHISKPIDPATLYNALLKWIEPGQRELPQDVVTEQNEEQIILVDIEGLDMAAGISRVGGNVKAYQNILLKFSQGQTDTLETIRRGLEDKDQEATVHGLHTLKGVSGNIGANELSTATKNLEDALKDNDKIQSDNALFLGLEAAFHKVVAAINETLSTGENSNKLPALPSEDLLDHIKALQFPIEQFDAQVEDALEKLLAHEAPPEINRELESIKAQLSKYDFEAAGKILKDLIRTLES